MLSKSPPLPKYYQLARRLSDQIAAGTLGPNDQLPTEEELSRDYHLSRGTVREAVRLLENDGLVRRERGRGTFVTAVRQPSSLFSLMPFSEAMHRQNREPTTRVLQATTLPASEKVAERLALAPNESVIHIARLRLADNQPVVYEERYLAHTLCPGLLGEDLTTSSVHTLMVFKYGVSLVKMSHTVEVGQLSDIHAQHLAAKPDDKAIFVDRLTYTEIDGSRLPAVWFQGIYREDSYDLNVRLQSSL